MLQRGTHEFVRHRITCDGCQLRSSNVAIKISRHLFESTLNIELVLLIVNLDENKFTFAIECVLQTVERDDVRITEDCGDRWRLISHAILRRSSLESERFATNRLLLLPQTTQIHGHHVVIPVRETRYFVRLVPWQITQIVGSTRLRAPLLIVRQHQISIFVVTTLLLRAVQTVKRNTRTIQEKNYAIFCVDFQRSTFFVVPFFLVRYSKLRNNHYFGAPVVTQCIAPLL